MYKAIITRFCYSSMGTFGALSIQNGKLAIFNGYTVERPWILNHPYTSCIPEGGYICKPVDSPKFGKTYEVTDVPNRTHILIHAGNVASDFQGCIGIGDTLGCLNSKWAVTNSRTTLKAFLTHFDRKEFLLVIKKE